MQTLKMILKHLEWSRSPAERDIFIESFRDLPQQLSSFRENNVRQFLKWLIFDCYFQPSATLSHHKHSMSPSCGSSVQGSHNHGSEFKCEICGKCFKHVRMLNRHRRNHSPYKKYKCAYCNKGFNDSFDLKRHVRTHTGLLSKKSPKNHQKHSKLFLYI